MEQCETCRFFRIIDDVPRCKCKENVGKDKEGNCDKYQQRWPDGIQIPDLKEPC